MAGEWRLPNIREMLSLVHYGLFDPAIPDTAGTGQWTEGNPFLGVEGAPIGRLRMSRVLIPPSGCFPWACRPSNSTTTARPSSIACGWFVADNDRSSGRFFPHGSALTRLTGRPANKYPRPASR